MKQAVILAAGSGRRIRRVLPGIPKCLADVGGASLIERHLDLLEEVDITRVCVLVGYEHDKIRSALGERCQYILNERYDSTNSLFSL